MRNQSLCTFSHDCIDLYHSFGLMPELRKYETLYLFDKPFCFDGKIAVQFSVHDMYTHCARLIKVECTMAGFEDSRPKTQAWNLASIGAILVQFQGF